MSKKQFLKIIRGFCAVQFLFVLIYVMQGGVEKSEMIIVVLSALFGAMLDGFSHTANNVGIFKSEKDRLDKEFDQLINEFDKDTNREK